VDKINIFDIKAEAGRALVDGIGSARFEKTEVALGQAKARTFRGQAEPEQRSDLCSIVLNLRADVVILPTNRMKMS
jgi:hypothetical protein